MSFTSRPLPRLLAVVAVLCLVAAACGDDSEGGDNVSAMGVWARSTAENQPHGAVYMDLTAGDEDDALISASVSDDIAGSVEIHETVAEGMDDMSDEMSDEMSDDEMEMGSMTMQEVDSIAIPAGESVALEPGGYHVMLLDLAGPLAAGDEFDLALSFETGEELTVSVEVRDS